MNLFPSLTVERNVALGIDATGRVAHLIGRHPAISLSGPVPHEQMQSLLNQTALLVQPSRRESYGMVLAEALLAGCPVLHTQGIAISGYFANAPFAGEAPRTPQALASAMVQMLRQQERIKAHLARAQTDGTLQILRRPAIAARYRAALAQAAGHPALAAA